MSRCMTFLNHSYAKIVYSVASVKFRKHLLLWVIGLFLCCQPQIFGQSANRKAKAGIIDLRQTDFLNHPVPLDGEWLMYPNELLGPQEHNSLSKGYFISFPTLWNNTVVQGKPMPAKGYATYALTVLLPKGIPANEAGLALPDFYSAIKLYTDGNEFIVSGKVGTNKLTSVPEYNPTTKRLRLNGDTLHILLQIANFHHYRGGPYQSIVIGNADALFRNQTSIRSFDLFLGGALFMGGLFFLGLYMFGRFDKPLLYFSLFCIAYCYRVLGSGQYSVRAVLPDFDWLIALRVEYLTLFASVAFFTQYTKHLYPIETNRWLVRSVLFVCILFSAITLVFPPTIFTYLVGPFLMMLAACIVLVILIYILAAIQGRQGAKYSLISTIALIITFLLSILQYFGTLDISNFIIVAGYILFFFFQSLILSYRFASILNKAKNEALEGLKAKSVFLSTISHEIRTPLNSIIGLSNLLLQKNPSVEQKEYLETLSFSANNLLGIINDILDFNKMEAASLTISEQPTDLQQLFQHLCKGMQSMSDAKGLQLIYDYDPQLVGKLLLVDAVRMSQVVNNLLHNAIKFTEKGTVQLLVQYTSSTENTITLQVIVRDTGIGIPKNMQSIVFEEFTQADSSVTREYGGAGLGLAICKKILKQQNVQLQLESEVGEGATFYFVQTFPLVGIDAPHQKTNDALVPTSEQAFLENGKVLVVEDNPINMMLVQKVLELIFPTIEIVKAVNGKIGVEAFLQHCPDVVLMDINMPVMDGLQASKMIRNHEASLGGRVPIIALTAGTISAELNNCMEAGMDTVISKPFGQEELRKAILNQITINQSTKL